MATTTSEPRHDRMVDGEPSSGTEPPLGAATVGTGQDHDATDSQVNRMPAARAVPAGGTSPRITARAGSRAALCAAPLIFAALLAAALDRPDAGASLPQVLTLCAGLLASLAALSRAGSSRLRSRRPTRVAVIGSQATAVALEQELASARVTTYESLGWIAPGADQSGAFPMPAPLGGIRELASIVERHRIELLLIGSGVPRLEIFDELVRLTDLVGVRVCELSAFYEDAFGRIPVAEINSTWFQYVMHPRFNPTEKHAKRAFDLTVATCLAIVALPAFLVAAVCVKLDGGSLLYRQRRIGENGRPFTMYKLRTMHERGPDDDSQTWCTYGDARVTRVGRVLRRLHIDELPQVYNILRGEMSVIGPRPEQPEIVARLEAGIAFYSRRHLMKPGLAGWAQLRCGYVRSDHGSAWKLCHDLYYLKHQSLRFDIVILLRTLLTLALPERAHAARAEGAHTERVGAGAGREPTAVGTE